MSLEQCGETFNAEDYQSSARALNVVICVYQRAAETADPSPVNRMLEQVQLRLKEKLEDYEEIRVAFISENPGLNVRGFQTLSKDTPVCYNEPGDRNHNLAHMWLMGLVLLEQRSKDAEKERTGKKQLANVLLERQNNISEYGGEENYLCLLTDEKFPREKAELLFTKTNGEVRMHTRFEKLSFCPVLLKSKRAGGELLEEYIRQKKGVVRIFKDDGGE